MPRTFLIFLLCLPLAVLMGFMLSDPLVGTNMAVGGGLILMLLLPFIINYHHRMLIWSSGALLVAYFIKGQPQVWMLIAMASLVMSVLSRPLAKEKTSLLWTGSLKWSMIFLAVVVVGTAKVSGGVGVKALGSEVYGGKRYLTVIMALVGLTALIMHRVPEKRLKTDLAVFTLAPATAAMSDLAYMLGPSFYFLYLIFPVDFAMSQASSDMTLGVYAMKRFNGFAPTCAAIVNFCMMRWGLRGMLQFKPWRHAFLALGLTLGLLSGFRSTLAIPLMLCVVHFFTEGLHRTRYAFGVVGIAGVAFGLAAAFSEDLPLPAQRALSFLPIRVNTIAKSDADSSMDWRLEMWSIVVKDVPKYLWKGKGYALDPNDLYLAEESMKRGFAKDFDFAIKAGDYHNGPLSVLIPFGIWGMIGFVWFCGASLRILWNNMRYGNPALRNANTFLFSYFVTRNIFFFIFFGAFEAEMWNLASLVGVALSINGGMAKKPVNARLEYQRRPQTAPAPQLVEA
jgi:hypothetical protein